MEEFLISRLLQQRKKVPEKVVETYIKKVLTLWRAAVRKSVTVLIDFASELSGA